MTHALERTNPTGQPFLGRCIKCGEEGLSMGGALVDCPADSIVSDDAALVQLIDPPAEETDGQLLARLGTDAAKWAAEFRKTAIGLGYSDMDEGWLIGWFANAMMVMHDHVLASPTEAADRIERLEAALAKAQDQIKGYEEAQASKRALTRQIAVLIDGEDAAKQPSLCDIVPMVRELVSGRTTEFRRGVAVGAASGWDACRKLATAGCAIMEAKASEALTCALPVHVEGFHRGEQTAARSLAKGLAAIEARDDHHFREALRAALTGEPS